MKIKKIFIYVLTLMISVFSLNISVKAEEVYVARIDDTMYTTLDEAVKASKTNDVITLLKDAETEGLNLNKDLTITSESESHYTITFTKYGIALWGNSLTFKDVDIFMTGIGSTPYTQEWNWMTISASTNASLTLENVNMTMDGTETKENVHAIYFCSNNILNLTNSTLIIKNYTQDALEWDGGDGGYNVNIIDSTFISDNNRSGFTGTFVATINKSKVDVINSKGNGSNGSHFIINDSTVNFNNNTAHGLSAGNLTINNSTVTADSNGANGIHVTGLLEVKNNSTLTITNNGCNISSKWTIPGALFVSGNGTIDKTTNLLISNNNGSGIYVKAGGSLTLETGTIVKNIAVKLGFGGGINNNGAIEISEGVEINNNKAEFAGDDIYSTTYIKLPKVVEDKALIEIREDNEKLNDCAHEINGWYDDSEAQDENTRWEAHAENEENDHIVLVNSGEYQGNLSIKAAHDKIKGTIIVNYVDSDNNKLTEEVIMSDVVGKEYTTEEKIFEGYKLISIDGETTGEYIEGVIYVTYHYDNNIGTGDIEPPKTGVEVYNFTHLTLSGPILYKKEEE